MNHKAPIIRTDYSKWLQVYRGITRATDEHTFITSNIPPTAVGHSAPTVDYQNGGAVSSALVMANMNSLPLDWAARLSVGGTNMSYFIVKQLPVLPPEAYLERPYLRSITYTELIVPRVLELTYTAHDLEGFARDLGYDGPPFQWDDQRRHLLQSELDAIYAHMYRLDRSDLEWILDAPPPSSSFPALKDKEIKQYGEYRTKRYVFQAFDQLSGGEPPSLHLNLP